MASEEVSQVQEVRYCLKTLRQQMAARQNHNNNNTEERFEEEMICRVQTAEEERRKTLEMQELVDGLKLENQALRNRVSSSEAEIQKLHQQKRDDGQEKCQRLEKELLHLKDKNYNLDDMLRSHQRKVRNMIEQVQNSRIMMEQRERLIEDLKERVSFLEAENREMQDQLEFHLGSKAPHASEPLSQVVYSKPLTPTSLGNKTLPFIKVVEIKSVMT